MRTAEDLLFCSLRCSLCSQFNPTHFLPLRPRLVLGLFPDAALSGVLSSTALSELVVSVMKLGEDALSFPGLPVRDVSTLVSSDVLFRGCNPRGQPEKLSLPSMEGAGWSEAQQDASNSI